MKEIEVNRKNIVLKHAEHFQCNDNDIICPSCHRKCSNEVSDNFDWMDNEIRHVECDCGNKYEVQIERPILVLTISFIEKEHK